MQPGIGAQLVEDERRHVLSRNASAMEGGEIRQGPDWATAWLIGQDGGPNENPVEPAISDDGFLAVLVGVHLLQEKRKDQVVEEKAAVSGAVAGAEPRDANQTGHVLGLHRLDEG